MQTPEEMALYERGTLDCAKCLHSFGNGVLLDGEPVKCPQCGHLVVPRMIYTPWGKRYVEFRRRLDSARKHLLVTGVAFVMVSACSGSGGIFLCTVFGVSALGFVANKHIEKTLRKELGR